MNQMIECFMNGGGEALCARPLEYGEAASAPGDPLGASVHPLHAVRIRLQVRVGEAAMTVAQLLAAREHEVLVLDRNLDEPVDLVLEGQVVARGQLVAVDGVFGVRIAELPVALRL